MIVAITGVTLAGKSTLAAFLKKMGYDVILEYTTRPMREGEADGVDYHFVDDDTFDKMHSKGEFVESLFVRTVFGVWKYGARKKDLVTAKNGLLTCGHTQMAQLLDSHIPMLSVLLDIDKKTAMERAVTRGDNLDEFERRFTKDFAEINTIRDRVDLTLNGSNSVETNARLIDNRVSLERISTAQKVSESEKLLYLIGEGGLKPYLRMRGKGMPEKPVNQIAWLLLCGSGCGFCKTCRQKPCDIKDGENCTDNIADYIRECVHAEDREGGSK